MDTSRGETPSWWSALGVPFDGRLASEATLKPDSAEERRVQRLRATVAVPRREHRLSVHRARLVTESYRETAGEHPAIRRAKAISRVFARIPIPFPESQLLLGTPAAALDLVEVTPEHVAWTQVGAEFLRPHDGFYLTPDDAAVYAEEIIPYWRGRGRGDHVLRELEANDPEALAYLRDSGAFLRSVGVGLSHTIQDYNSVLTRGLDAMKAEIRAKLDEIDGATPRDVGDLERRNVYRAMLICADGLIAYAARCADLAETAAAGEADPARAAELRELARICRTVPRLPASGWWECLQSLHLCRMGTALAEGGGSHSVGRFDQYVYPFLRADLDAGRLSRERAQELLECFFVKWNEVRVYAPGRAGGTVGMRQNDKLTIGGVDARGRDVTNELSFMCLEAQAHVHLNDPNVSLRLHRGTPDALLRRALEVLRLGGGLPQLISDEAIVPSLISTCGLTLADARNYADIGCQENTSDPNVSPGRDTNGYTNAGWFNLAKPVELALHDGVDPITDLRVGPRTGDPRGFATMDDFVSAVRAQFDHAARMNARVVSAIEYTYARYYPLVFHDLMHPGPRERGVDLAAGGCHYNWSGSLGVGLASGGDALAAVNYLVYEARLASWDELAAALRSNWAEPAGLRKLALAAPKYGAGDLAADRWTRLVSDLYADAFAKCRTPKGGPVVVGYASMATFVYLGKTVGALPDGRAHGEPLADSTSPTMHAPALGPTAAHLSNARGIDTLRAPNGVVFNQRFSAGAVATDRDLAKWADLVRTFVEAGGQSVQYTVADGETLRAAQREPERYRDLVVRVGGYSATFVELGAEVQDAIIARAEQRL